MEDSIKIENLELSLSNPRNHIIENDDYITEMRNKNKDYSDVKELEAIMFLIKDDYKKYKSLLENIIDKDYGLVDEWIGIFEKENSKKDKEKNDNKKYIVFEGNRRISILKLLNNNNKTKFLDLIKRDDFTDEDRKNLRNIYNFANDLMNTKNDYTVITSLKSNFYKIYDDNEKITQFLYNRHINGRKIGSSEWNRGKYFLDIINYFNRKNIISTESNILDETALKSAASRFYKNFNSLKNDYNDAVFVYQVVSNNFFKNNKYDVHEIEKFLIENKISALQTNFAKSYLKNIFENLFINSKIDNKINLSSFFNPKIRKNSKIPGLNENYFNEIKDKDVIEAFDNGENLLTLLSKFLFNSYDYRINDETIKNKRFQLLTTRWNNKNKDKIIELFINDVLANSNSEFIKRCLNSANNVYKKMFINVVSKHPDLNQEKEELCIIEEKEKSISRLSSKFQNLFSFIPFLRDLINQLKVNTEKGFWHATLATIRTLTNYLMKLAFLNELENTKSCEDKFEKVKTIISLEKDNFKEKDWEFVTKETNITKKEELWKLISYLIKSNFFIGNSNINEVLSKRDLEIILNENFNSKIKQILKNLEKNYVFNIDFMVESLKIFLKEESKNFKLNEKLELLKNRVNPKFRTFWKGVHFYAIQI